MRNILLTFIVFVNFLVFNISDAQAQITPIINYSTDINGRVQLEVNSSVDYYYILKVRHNLDSAFDITASMTLGEVGTTNITEALSVYSIDHYQVLEYPINSPNDTDEDSIDDITEYNSFPFQNPLNTANPIDIEHGLVGIDTISTFNELSIEQDHVPWLPFINEKKYLKYIILDFYTSNPKVYFINTNTYSLHAEFAAYLNIDHLAPSVVKGHMVYHPTILANNGTLGVFAFNYTNNLSEPFTTVQKTQELLAASMPFLKNNISYFINSNNEDAYYSESELFQNSRITVVFESDVYAGVNYWGLNQTEGYGFFREVGLDEIPNPKDIALYQSIPNSLPSVGGIITSEIQTPLSHVNLRAIQNNIPNAFIRDPLSNDTISSLLNHYIYFNVEQSNYTIREATIEEVNDWYDNKRPKHTQDPPLNLDYKTIFPLDEIFFDMYDGFGAKVTNVSTLRKFDFPEGTIPDGYGIPFYYYQEFMKCNDFFNEIEGIISDQDFINDRQVRDLLLKEFRQKIKNATMPSWMMDDFGEMHSFFPEGTSVRCRSSTNNEDLPGFSGAGLYDSKTQHPEEGHISKSIKQVYASIWNLRAFEERDFYRVNHFLSSMGILCHPNYSDEKVNGVGVSIDPVYNTSNTFYINSQLDEELVTNPLNNAKPEELLLYVNPIEEDLYSVIQYSSFLGYDSLLMNDFHLNQLKDFLSIIHDEFEPLYGAENNTTFTMEIEYKITSENQLIIKQARPWITYVPNETTFDTTEQCDIVVFPNPSTEYINITYKCKLNAIKIFNTSGKMMIDKVIDNSIGTNIHIPIQNLSSGIYIIVGYDNEKNSFSKRLIIY